MPTASTSSSSPVRSWPPALSELPCARPLFELGQCRMTHGAQSLLQRRAFDPSQLLTAHITGAWQGGPGTTCDEDARANLSALASGARIMGFFSLGGDGSADDDERVWIITDAVHPDTGRRWLTTILLPWEY